MSTLNMLKLVPQNLQTQKKLKRILQAQIIQAQMSNVNFNYYSDKWTLMLVLQMTKLAIIPFTVLLETIFLKKQFR